MNTIPSPAVEVGQYIKGDILLVQCDAPDPFEGWLQFAEDNAHDLRAVRVNGALAGVIGYFMRSRYESDAFAVMDRNACAGHGMAVAKAVRARQLQWMEEISVTRAWADCPIKDRAAQVFLRAIGYRRVAGEEPGTAYFVLDWRR